MQLNIGNKDYTIHLGIDALAYLDDKYNTIEPTTGLKIGYGVTALNAYLEMANVLALVTFIKAGTSTEYQKPSNKDIEEYLGSLELEDLDKLFKEAQDELGKQPLTRLAIKRTEKAIAEEAKKKA